MAAAGFSLGELRRWGAKLHNAPRPSDPSRRKGIETGTINAIFDEGIKSWGHTALDHGFRFLPIDGIVLKHMIGAYLAYWFAKLTGSLWLAIPIGIVIAFAIGLLLETAIFSRLYKRDHLYQVLLTFGLILIFEELRSILFGDEVHGVAIPALLDYSIPLTDTLSYPVYRLFITVVCLAIAGLLYFVIHKTRIGM